MIKSFMIIRNFFVNFLSDMFYHLINGKKHYESFNERKRHDYRSDTLTQLLRFFSVLIINQRFAFLICFTVFYKF